MFGRQSRAQLVTARTTMPGATPPPGNPMGEGSRQYTYPSPVNVGWDYPLDGSVLDTYAGVYIPDQKHLGIGVRDMALVQPTGDPLDGAITRAHSARPGIYNPAGGGFGVLQGTARVQSDGNYYPRTLNPVQSAHVIATQELVYSDLAGNGGVLQGTFDLTPLLDVQALNKTGPGSVGG